MARILNLARLERKLRRLPTAALAEIKPAMEAAAKEMVAMMKSLVPEDTGALKDSIGWTWGKAPKGSMVIAAVKASLGGELTITIYAGSRDKGLGDMDAYYARWVEFGTQKMTARPYFYVSYRANKKSAGRKIRAGVRRAAKKVAAGG
ncbi:HK97 gp10 family phage protein [Cereibacter azotoformans]|uniref:HK97-gp10 family putative phage morphogenesis protein n=1 Tax=Cereibacter azotoformans TaxID=43057 RepID=UPI000E358FC1|nr:HK97-gp10 family putative phage morphogenesis protein [Cereibacter azotoformans]AXQ93203.1 HK97 gp10 family phage protein [Cereibacter sphaeroides]UIJ31515.1 HK97 gp10 family phage protein [Cereibacter azotoformans]